jgi:hypothetical protein
MDCAPFIFLECALQRLQFQPNPLKQFFVGLSFKYFNCICGRGSSTDHSPARCLRSYFVALFFSSDAVGKITKRTEVSSLEKQVLLK